jgi:hypothetical protein
MMLDLVSRHCFVAFGRLHFYCTAVSQLTTCVLLRFNMIDPNKPDIYEVDALIVETCLLHPERIQYLPVRKPRYESQLLTMEEV